MHREQAYQLKSCQQIACFLTYHMLSFIMSNFYNIHPVVFLTTVMIKYLSNTTNTFAFSDIEVCVGTTFQYFGP
jgi:hypothetical protein